MIICAAVKFHIDKTNMDVVIPCRRHYEAFAIMHDLGFSNGHDCHHIDDGFIDHKSNFLSREEAYNHAIECGQLSATTRQNINNGILFSEDIY